jgi:hypothetical protein
MLLFTFLHAMHEESNLKHRLLNPKFVKHLNLNNEVKLCAPFSTAKNYL